MTEATNSIAQAAVQARPQRVYVDRSRHETLHRCRRLRWLEYHAGSAHRGLVPKKKSIHLVLGGAVHAGLAVLLDGASQWLRDTLFLRTSPTTEYKPPIEELLQELFTKSIPEYGDITTARQIENRAVETALLDFKAASTFGVELDDLEQEGMKKLLQAVAATGEGALQQVSMAGDSPLTIDFSDIFSTMPEVPKEVIAPIPIAFEGQLSSDWNNTAEGATRASFNDQLKASLTLEQANTTTELDWGAPVYLDEQKPRPAVGLAVQSPEDQLLQQEIRTDANQARITGLDSYLKDELAALVEAMVRAYARRRWRPLLEEFEVLEVEREGEWKLGELKANTDWWKCQVCDWMGNNPLFENTGEYCPKCKEGHVDSLAEDLEIWFMSRHDGLLLERKTGFLYLLSYKTTGAWDRRREADAQVDMQGLSEAVDVEKRFEEAWGLLQKLAVSKELLSLQEQVGNTLQEFMHARVKELVDGQTAQWLQSLPEPPKILGVRYEYLLKGQRRADKYDQELPGRYVADTPLVRGLKFDNITVDDRRWAHSRDYFTELGKSSSLYWKNWKKAPVWRYMTIAQWIDMLDRGEVQPDAYDERGGKVDCLADQFCTPITVYRQEDDMRDMLQQLEAEEVETAQKVLRVRQAEATGDTGLIRTALNQNFAQSRKSCSYPGKCAHWESCYGSPTIRQDPENSGLYVIRQPNHPVELT